MAQSDCREKFRLLDGKTFALLSFQILSQGRSRPLLRCIQSQVQQRREVDRTWNLRNITELPKFSLNSSMFPCWLRSLNLPILSFFLSFFFFFAKHRDFLYLRILICKTMLMYPTLASNLIGLTAFN